MAKNAGLGEVTFYDVTSGQRYLYEGEDIVPSGPPLPEETDDEIIELTEEVEDIIDLGEPIE